MRTSELVYGEASDVADYLHYTDSDNIDVGTLTSALVNALNRIDYLESMVRDLQDRVVARDPARIRAESESDQAQADLAADGYREYDEGDLDEDF